MTAKDKITTVKESAEQFIPILKQLSEIQQAYLRGYAKGFSDAQRMSPTPKAG